jgi:hypothetical protein
MLFLLNTVSYAAMTFTVMIEEEIAYYSSPEFLKAQARQRRHETLMSIFYQIRSGKKLPMFAENHRIKPQELVNALSV